ncbi:MAG: hypothetical protein GXO75_16410 [Calditrichaeota bacterium]|nr:hypothetical protein [Calditrichota bacterium]
MRLSQIEIHFPDKENLFAQMDQKASIDNYFPEKEANILSKQESYNKHLFRPNTYLHKWWARRSGSTFRYILKQLVQDITLRDYYSSGGLEGVVVLDPMMGGGTTLHEAIRLGANVIGFDIDPIPVLQAKASLANIDPYDKVRAFDEFILRLREKNSSYYITHCPVCGATAEIQFTLYGIRKKYQGREVLVVDSFVIKEKSNGNDILLDHFYPDRKVEYEQKHWDVLDKEFAKKNKMNGKDFDLLDIPITERYTPILILGHCKAHGSFYKKPDNKDIDVIKRTKNVLKNCKIPDDNLFKIYAGPKSKDLVARNIVSYSQLFTPRQLLFLDTAKSLLETAPNRHKIWLALLLSTSLEFNSILCGYKGAEKRRPGAIRHVFSHHAYSFPYTALENNPLFYGNSSGTLERLFNSRILAASKWAQAPVERYKKNGMWAKTTLLNESDIGSECHTIDDFRNHKKMFFVRQNDSSNLPLPNSCVDFVVTDPPYYDSVQYSDLSHFFRCWLQWFLPHETNWNYLTDNSAVAASSKDNNKYCESLSNIWSECNRVLKRPHGRLIFTFHHWKPDDWAHLAISLQYP